MKLYDYKTFALDTPFHQRVKQDKICLCMPWRSLWRSICNSLMENSTNTLKIKPLCQWVSADLKEIHESKSTFL